MVDRLSSVLPPPVGVAVLFGRGDSSGVPFLPAFGVALGINFGVAFALVLCAWLTGVGSGVVDRLPRLLPPRVGVAVALGRGEEVGRGLRVAEHVVQRPEERAALGLERERLNEKGITVLIGDLVG